MKRLFIGTAIALVLIANGLHDGANAKPPKSGGKSVPVPPPSPPPPPPPPLPPPSPAPPLESPDYVKAGVSPDH